MAAAVSFPAIMTMNVTYLPFGLEFPEEASRNGWLFMPSNGGCSYIDGVSTITLLRRIWALTLHRIEGIAWLSSLSRPVVIRKGCLSI